MMRPVFRDAFRDALGFCDRHKKKQRKRGRPPLGRRAMTDAERQAKQRQKRRTLARQRLVELKQAAGIGTYQPPKGYRRAKETLIKLGHAFERARREWGFEEGVFVDGAFVSSHEVIALADLPSSERRQLLEQARQQNKDVAIEAVVAFMRAMRVSVDELRAAD
jgi:hypothetical protein